MAPHDDLYRDSALSEDWDYAMRGVLVRNDRVLYDSVVAWSRGLRDGSFDPMEYRTMILQLMEGDDQHEPQQVTTHYHHTAREDIFHRLVAGQPVNIDRCIPWVEDSASNSYGPIPTPVSYIPQFLCDVQQAGFLREDVTMQEVGCGTGLTTVAAALMSNTRLRINGLDWNTTAVEIARRTAKSLGLEQCTFEVGRIQQMDLSKGDIFYLHSPFKGGSPEELRFCGNLVREAESRSLLIATLYDVTMPFSIRLPHLNKADGYNGIALFGSRPA